MRVERQQHGKETWSEIVDERAGGRVNRQIDQQPVTAEGHKTDI